MLDIVSVISDEQGEPSWSCIVDTHASLVPLARTERRMSMVDETLHWWKEYAVAVLDTVSRDALHTAFPQEGCTLWMVAHPVAFLRRRVDQHPDGRLHPRQWELLSIGAYAWDAAQCSDTAWEQAASLHPLHAHRIQINALISAIRDEQTRLTQEVERLQAARKRLELPLTRTFYSDELASSLKHKRIWAKALRGEVPAEAIEVVRAPIRQHMNEEIDRRTARLQVIPHEITQLQHGGDVPPLLPGIPSVLVHNEEIDDVAA